MRARVSHHAAVLARRKGLRPPTAARRARPCPALRSVAYGRRRCALAVRSSHVRVSSCPLCFPPSVAPLAARQSPRPCRSRCVVPPAFGAGLICRRLAPSSSVPLPFSAVSRLTFPCVPLALPSSAWAQPPAVLACSGFVSFRRPARQSSAGSSGAVAAVFLLALPSSPRSSPSPRPAAGSSFNRGASAPFFFNPLYTLQPRGCLQSLSSQFNVTNIRDADRVSK